MNVAKSSRDLENYQDPYEQALRDAIEQINVIAVRGGVDAGHILIEFDADRGPGPYTEHTLTISVRNSDIIVTATHVPHTWLATGTGFIDTRLSRLAHTLLTELDKKALAARRLI